MASIKLFCENQSKRQDTVGKVCRAILEDEHMRWTGTNREIMQEISMTRRSAGIHQKAMKRFFSELKKNLYHEC